MQQLQETFTKDQVAVSLQKKFEAVKALEEWKKKYGGKLKNWDFIAVLRHWREQRGKV